MNFHIDYLLHLADTALILSHRNSEWCGHGPVLEQDIAISNISLDLLGQSRYFYQHAATMINQINGNDSCTEDTLAYLRTEREFKNLLMCELPKGDWAQTILRQFLIGSYQELSYTELLKSKDTHIAAIAEKSLKEINYHVKWSGEWVIRLGDGTEESRARMIAAIDYLWPYSGEAFIPVVYENEAFKAGIGTDTTLLKSEWEKRVSDIFTQATIPFPAKVFMQTGGKNGVHTEHLGYILTDMQYLQRTYPGAEW